jgi:5-amino-6-(5-phosphoribosylamino)uracil reductase
VYLLRAPETTLITDPLDLSLADLQQLYAVDEALPIVRANLVVSLDGQISAADGRSESLSTEDDRLIFALLRSLSDAIIVGARTVRAEKYKLPVITREELVVAREESGREKPPVLVIISRSGQLDPTLECLQQPTIVITPSTTPPEAIAALTKVVEVVQLPGEEISFHQIISLLRDRGLTQILVEGGTALLSTMLEQQAIDELCLTLSPQLVGAHGQPLIEGIAAGSSLDLAHLVAAPNCLFTRYRVVGD